MKRPSSISGNGAGGFTIIEVLLAMSIAIGLLVVAIHFYRQAAEVRAQILVESERISEVRQLMDRITGDLRTAFGQARDGFLGDSNSMRFVRSEPLSRSAWMAPAGSSRETGLKVVNYSVSAASEGTNTLVSGVIRTEADLAAAVAAGAAVPDVAGISDVSTNEVATTNVVKRAVERAVEPITAHIHYVRYRYWEGSGWVEMWNASTLPKGVEVTFGFDPLPEGEPFEDYPFEVFRRVISLPGGSMGVSELDLLANRAKPAVLTAKNR
jgi:type II secretory pathway component PulJ